MDKADKEGNTSHGTKERLYEVVSHYLVYGEKTADMLDIKDNTLKRYLRRARALGLDIEKGRVLKEIEKNRK